MLDVKFKKVGSGTCSWCRRPKDEVFTIEIAGRERAFCRKDLFCAIMAELGSEPSRPATAANDKK